MAWIIGLVSRSELAELRRRGWEDEDAPDQMRGADEIRGKDESVTRAFFVDSDVFEIMSGPDWDQDPGDRDLSDDNN